MLVQERCQAFTWLCIAHWSPVFAPVAMLAMQSDMVAREVAEMVSLVGT